MSESIDVQIQGEINLNAENRSMYEGFEKSTKASIWKKNSLFLMRKYDKVYDYPLEGLIVVIFYNSLFRGSNYLDIMDNIPFYHIL